MALPDSSALTAGVQAVTAGHEASSPAAVAASLPLMILTWVTFLILAAILYKVAWKPILTALDMRESRIRKALEGVEKARAETAELEARQRQLLQETQAHSQAMLAEARKAALETGRQIENRAREEARMRLDKAQEEIRGAVERARAELRREGADLAITLATRIMKENMDTAANKKLIAELLKESDR